MKRGNQGFGVIRLVPGIFPPKTRISVSWKGCDLVGKFVVPGLIPLEGMFFFKRKYDSVFRHHFLGDFHVTTGKSGSERFESEWQRFFCFAGDVLTRPKCSKIQGDERERHRFMPALPFPHR